MYEIIFPYGVTILEYVSMYDSSCKLVNGVISPLIKCDIVIINIPYSVDDVVVFLNMFLIITDTIPLAIIIGIALAMLIVGRPKEKSEILRELATLDKSCCVAIGEIDAMADVGRALDYYGFKRTPVQNVYEKE